MEVRDGRGHLSSFRHGVSFSLSKHALCIMVLQGFSKGFEVDQSGSFLEILSSTEWSLFASPQERESQYSKGRFTGFAKQSICSVNTEA